MWFFNFFCVKALGNHEFDDGIKGLIPFLKAVEFPVVITNLNISSDHELIKTNSVKRSTVFNYNEHKVGVIGYLTPDSVNMANTGDIVFLPEVPSIK